MSTYLSFIFIELVVVARVRLHGDEQVSEGALEGRPVMTVVKEVQHEGLYLHLVQVWEEHVDAVDQQLDGEFLILSIAVLLPIFSVDLAEKYAWAVDYLKHLLEDLSLELEARHMAIVSHHCEDVLDYQHVEVLVED